MLVYARHVEAVRALRDDDGVEIDLAANELPIDVDWPERPVEQILARFEPLPAQAAERVAREEGKSVGEHPALDQHLGKSPCSCSGLHFEDQALRISSIRPIEFPRRERRRAYH